MNMNIKNHLTPRAIFSQLVLEPDLWWRRGVWSPTFGGVERRIEKSWSLITHTPSHDRFAVFVFPLLC